MTKPDVGRIGDRHKERERERGGTEREKAMLTAVVILVAFVELRGFMIAHNDLYYENYN